MDSPEKEYLYINYFMEQTINESTLNECKKELKDKLSGKWSVISETYLDWFAEKKAKSDEDLTRECNRTADELKKTLEYWRHRYFFTKDEFIANMKYSKLGFRELKEISEAAQKLSEEKKDAFIADLQRQIEEAENA